MDHITLPKGVLDNIELPPYELHTRPCPDNCRKLNVFYGNRLIGSVYINYCTAGQSNYVGATLDHQSFGPFSRRNEAVEAVFSVFNTNLTDQQRLTVALANEIAENMSVIAG